MPYDKYAHADAYYEQLEKREYDKGLREREVKALEKIAHFLGQIAEEGILTYDGHDTVVPKKDKTT